jgi:hypothetical protein
MNRFGTRTISVSLAVLFLGLPLVATPQSKQVPPAPIPAPILSAKRVFIANGGGDESAYDPSQYGGGPHRAYNEFYAAIKAWGQYELVSAPGDADLVLEIRLAVIQLQRERVLAADDSVLYDPQVTLIIREAKSHETLWGLTEHIQVAVLQSNREKNFEQALAKLVAEVKRIAGPEPGSALPARN